MMLADNDFISSQIPCKESSSTYFKSTEFREEQTITYDNYVWCTHSLWHINYDPYNA